MSGLRACLSVFLIGCDQPAKPPSTPEDEPSPQREEASSPVEPQPPAARPQSAAPLRATLAEVRTVGEAVDVERCD
jgi:hypothetical protein